MAGNNKITDKFLMANQFSTFFSQIGMKMVDKINSTNENLNFRTFLRHKYSTTFSFTPVNEKEVSDVIRKLNNKTSVGYDGISTILLKRLEPVLLKPITHIINKSFITGIFPDKLKISRIIPIHKKDDIHIIDNYRPISLLPAISKILEKISYNQFFAYLSQLKYICQTQYGFRESHSTEHAVLELTNRILNDLDIGHCPMAIFIDLSKAFDTLDHHILLEKLHSYGVNNLSYNWFKSYLQDRPYYVDFDNINSDRNVISLGVPQGSILGPLLFLIYVNDINNSSDFFTFIKYADDTNLYIPTIQLTTEYYNVVNCELKKIHTWLRVNKLSLNINKSIFMVFYSVRKTVNLEDFSIKINDVSIERVHKFNFLGVIIDENVTWNNHIDYIFSKISRTIGMLKRLKHELPTHILKIIYNSLILPHLTYGILAWGKKSIKIFHIQKKAIRVITRSNYNAHTEPLFKSLGLLKFEDLFMLMALKFFYKYCHNLLPSYFQLINFEHRQDIHGYNTRAKNLLQIAKINTKLAESSLMYFIPQIINNIPEIIIDKIFTHAFSFYIKNYFINMYENQCRIDNCYICNNI